MTYYIADVGGKPQLFDDKTRKPRKNEYIRVWHHDYAEICRLLQIIRQWIKIKAIDKRKATLNKKRREAGRLAAVAVKLLSRSDYGQQEHRECEQNKCF